MLATTLGKCSLSGVDSGEHSVAPPDYMTCKVSRVPLGFGAWHQVPFGIENARSQNWFYSKAYRGPQHD